MHKLVLLFSLFCTPSFAAQSPVEGKVVDSNQQPVPGANVYLKDTYDGASTDAVGNFSFSTSETGERILVVSFMGYQTQELLLQLPHHGSAISVTLQEAFNKLNGITVTAGAFGASDEKKGVTLRPLDVVTTAGATGDLIGAMNTLPGTQKVGETGRLFVRGGEGNETRTFVDGLWVQNPYAASTSNLPTRSRFSPFLFKGTLFSTGGYSAEYSQALSSTLALNTTDFQEESRTDISLMTVGGGLAHTFTGEKQALTADLSYTNLQPYFRLQKQNVTWDKAPESFSGSAVYRHKITKTGLLKVYATYSQSALAVQRLDDETLTRLVNTRVDNQFGYVNASYRDAIGKRWTVFAGAAYNYNADEFAIDVAPVAKTEKSVHLKNTWTFGWSERVAIRFGGESFLSRTDFRNDENRASISDQFLGAFGEADVYISRKLTAKVGVRLDYSALQTQTSVAPRLSVAYQTSENSQVSAAYGIFSQQPGSDWLRYNRQLPFEQATHYQLTYQRTKENRTFRAEAYHKQYDNLVQYDGATFSGISSVKGGGNGYARGLDVFWRDKQTVKNLEYWLSYSYLDTRRLYQNYPQAAVPTFASAHNLSVVTKYFVPAIRTQVGGSFSYTSPRPYHDPNQDGFNAQRTPAYVDVSVNASFLYRQHIIFHVSATNLPGRNNVFGYRFAQKPDASGAYRHEAIRQGAPRFLFVGVFITLSNNQAENQLETL